MFSLLRMATIAGMKTRFLLVALLLTAACAPSYHAVQRSTLGTARTSQDLLSVAKEPGPIEVETINSADWKVARSGLINLDHPTAEKAHLEDGDEPIQVYFHVIRHPVHGTFIIDTGV